MKKWRLILVTMLMMTAIYGCQRQAKETGAAAQASTGSETTVGETTASGETVAASETTAGETTAAGETAAASETTAAGETAAAREKATTGETAGADAVSSASLLYYETSSLDRDELWQAIADRTGGCTIASVNEDDSPNLIVAVPGTAEKDYIYFTWADNVTKENAIRTGEVIMCYYLYNAAAENKEERNSGARVRLSLVSDETVIDRLKQEYPAVGAATVFQVKEILPIG